MYDVSKRTQYVEILQRVYTMIVVALQIDNIGVTKTKRGKPRFKNGLCGRQR